MEFLNIDEVAEILELSVSSLRRMRLENKGPKSIKRAGRVRYRPEDVHQWLDEQDKATSRGGFRRTVKTFEDVFVE